MKLAPSHSPIAETSADAVVIGVFDDKKLGPSAAAVDRATDRQLTRLIDAKEFSGKSFETLALMAPAGISAMQVLVIGLGERSKFDTGMAYRASAAAAKHLASKVRPTLAYFLDAIDSPALAENAVCGSLVGSQGQDLYRAERKLHPPETILWNGIDESTLDRGRILGESVNLTRRLVNAPADEIYPESFAAEAAIVARDGSLSLEIWDEPKLNAERCGALLAVAKGSNRPPRLIMLRYQGGAKDAPPLAIVGKGVTFDSGGLSLKSPENMMGMKCDMAGAATMLGAMRAIAMLRLPVNVIGMAGLVENMTGPAAMKLGDVLTARNGRTIEVHNTDAEGRLVLADVLSVAVDLGVAKIVDLATLTGACVVALGTEVAGLMSNNQQWCDTITAAATRCGEPVWQLPMFPEVYDDLIRSDVADIKNVGDGRWGGAITAAKFLEQFVADKPWTHIDIAGPAFREKPKPWSDCGGTGQYVRTLVELCKASWIEFSNNLP
jgi:leucyl aminopeptidase